MADKKNSELTSQDIYDVKMTIHSLSVKYRSGVLDVPAPPKQAKRKKWTKRQNNKLVKQLAAELGIKGKI